MILTCLKLLQSFMYGLLASEVGLLMLISALTSDLILSRVISSKLAAHDITHGHNGLPSSQPQFRKNAVEKVFSGFGRSSRHGIFHLPSLARPHTPSPWRQTSTIHCTACRTGLDA